MRSDIERPARDTVSVDGVFASDVVVPNDAQEAADILAGAHARGEAIVPVGGGTALALGNSPERVDRVLATARLSGILDYEPTDLVLSVGAGAKFGDVQAVLAEHGQRLPLDPPGGGEATIGGLIATARWGPLRTSAGTLRDLLIGISVAHPSGTVSRAGGMVVKNVSGYDMPRLYHGSLGTLGVIISANFKVLPRPRAEASIVTSFANPDGAFAAAGRLRASHDPVAALEVARRDGAWLLATRIEGREQTVAAAATRIAATVGGESMHLDGVESAAWWTEYVARQAEYDAVSRVLVRAGTRPRDTAILALGIDAEMDSLGVAVPFLAASPALGSVFADLDLGNDGSAERLAEIQAVVAALADAVTIVSAPPAWKQGIDVWGPIPEGFAVMRSLREQFDPGRTINPGRFAGFL